jgi:uncharacterized protein YndB with AHSA1/START domain
VKKALKGAAVLALATAVGVFIAVQTATTVRQLRQPSELRPNGAAEKTRTADALDYSVAIQISAPPQIIWALLTDAKAYPQWSSTVAKVGGTIAKGETIQLTASSVPDRPFPLKVSEVEKNVRMVWEDCSRAFCGVRTFTLIPGPGGASTTFAMSETLSGRLLPLIEGRLPDFTPEFNAFAHDLKVAAEKVAPPVDAPPPAVPLPGGM